MCLALLAAFPYFTTPFLFYHFFISNNLLRNTINLNQARSKRKFNWIQLNIRLNYIDVSDVT